MLIKVFCIHLDDDDRAVIRVRLHGENGGPEFSISASEPLSSPWDNPGPGVLFQLGCTECGCELSLSVYYEIGQTKIEWQDDGLWLLEAEEDGKPWQLTPPPRLHGDAIYFNREAEPGPGPLLCSRCRSALAITEIWASNRFDPVRSMMSLWPHGEHGDEPGVAFNIEARGLLEAGDASGLQSVTFKAVCPECRREHHLQVRFSRPVATTKLYWGVGYTEEDTKQRRREEAPRKSCSLNHWIAEQEERRALERRITARRARRDPPTGPRGSPKLDAEVRRLRAKFGLPPSRP